MAAMHVSSCAGRVWLPFSDAMLERVYSEPLSG
jgi:hypothetical protein